ncbi:MAG: CheR family methyltransferase [Nitrospinales bacterium]
MSLTLQDFNFLRQLIQERSGIVFGPGKEYLVETRLAPIIKTRPIQSINDLVDNLRTQENKELLDKVIDALTTNETYFFRDIHPFEALKEKVIPMLLNKRQKNQKLNIWCGATSSGQEAYSIAILIREYFPQLKDWEINIMATDISLDMVERSTTGRFSQLEMDRGLPTNHKINYFDRRGSEWEAKPIIKDMIRFSRFNLSEPFPLLPLMDIVFMRNVLIYFGIQMKKVILAEIIEIMRKDGFLFLGGAETTLNLSQAFEKLNYQLSGCYYLKQGT